MSFNKIFKQISQDEIQESVFKLLGKDFFIIAVGDNTKYNAMIGSGGYFGVLMGKPTTVCYVRGDRYTLEIIKKTKKYTLTFLRDEDKPKMFFFGKTSGREMNKMNGHELVACETPNGVVSFEEAKLIVECKLVQLTTARPDDFVDKEAKGYAMQAYEEDKVYRELMFGEISNVWVRKG